LHELAIKAAPLILIAVGLSVCYRSNNWNIGAEGQFIAGAVFGSILPILFPETVGWWVLPLMLVLGMAGGAAYAAMPAFLKARFNTNEILTSLMLVYVAQLFLDWLVRGPWRDPQGFNFPQSVSFNASAILPELLPMSGRANAGFLLRTHRRGGDLWFLLAKTLKGFEIRVLGSSPRAGRFAGFQINRMVFFAFLLSGALAGLAGISEVAGAIGKTAAEHFARLRLYRDHRCLPRPAQSARHRRGRPGAGADLSGRRGVQLGAWRLRQGRARVPGHAAVLRARLRHADQLPIRFVGTTTGPPAPAPAKTLPEAAH
jgi:simple sugar transport system permease protein